MKRIIVWHQGALGDLILSLPAIRSIRNGGANVFLHLISRTDLADIIISNGIADRVSCSGSALFAGFFGADSAPAADLLKPYDAVFVFARAGGDLLETVGNHVRRTLLIRTVPPEGLRMHVSEFQLAQLRDAGIRTDEAKMPLEWPGGVAGMAGKKVVSIHPGSGGSRKCWPLRRYLELVDNLQVSGDLSFRILLGPAEGDSMRHEVASFIRRRSLPAEIVGNERVPAIASILRNSALYLGNDSGVSHLAAALGVPSVVLFGPTDPAQWRPWGSRVHVIRAAYPCSPCGDGYRRCPEQACLEAITPEMVRAAVRECLGGRGVQSGSLP